MTEIRERTKELLNKLASHSNEDIRKMAKLLEELAKEYEALSKEHEELKEVVALAIPRLTFTASELTRAKNND